MAINEARQAQARTEIGAMLDQIKKEHASFYQPEMNVSMVPLLEQQVGKVRLARSVAAVAMKSIIRIHRRIYWNRAAVHPAWP
jgi:hypothetical protein